jgi:cytochrome c oxidase subunit 2
MEIKMKNVILRAWKFASKPARKTLNSIAAFLTILLMSATSAYAVLGQPELKEMGLQAAASPVKAMMIHFHDDLLMPIIVSIVILVMVLLFIIIVRFNEKSNPVPSKTTHNTLLEVLWTLVPILILVAVVIPSMKMLYFSDRTKESEMTLKVTGYQWYWGYDYLDNGNISFMSNLVKEEELKDGQPRLLATDNPIVLPVDTNIKILITASDVIHSWAVPAFGIKTDAVPGRTNETWVRIDKEGTFYGQCSELCGQGHGFMPIEVKAVSKAAFAEWVAKQGGKMPQKDIPSAEAPKAGAPEAKEKELTKDTAGEKK